MDKRTSVSKTLDDAIAAGGGTPSGQFPAPEGPLPPLTMAGMRPPRRGQPRTLDDCIAAGSGTPGTIMTDDELDAWMIARAVRE